MISFRVINLYFLFILLIKLALNRHYQVFASDRKHGWHGTSESDTMPRETFIVVVLREIDRLKRERLLFVSHATMLLNCNFVTYQSIIIKSLFIHEPSIALTIFAPFTRP